MTGRRQERVRIGIIGLGWIGLELARAAREDPRVELVGLADSDPSKAKRDLGELIGEGRVGLQIDGRSKDMLARERPEVVVVSTSSRVDDVSKTIRECIDHGAHVVSTCENLAAPHHLDSRGIRQLEKHAIEREVAVISTGVNPGFVMDRLPSLLAKATRNIRRVRVRRVVDAATRRMQLQAKVGVGMTKQQFQDLAATGGIGHAGLIASLQLVGDGIGIDFDHTVEELRPLLIKSAVTSPSWGRIPKGRVRGIHQVARGFVGDYEMVTLELVMALGEREPKDSIDIIGEPPIHFEGECPGDNCTIATALSAISQVVWMKPGMRNVLELGLDEPGIVVPRLPGRAPKATKKKKTAAAKKKAPAAKKKKTAVKKKAPAAKKKTPSKKRR